MAPSNKYSDDGAARLRSQAVWDQMAAGWQADRDWFWQISRSVSEWMIRKVDPQPGDTVLDLAAGLGETGFLAAPLVGEAGRIITADFAPAMIAAARQRAGELGLTNVEFLPLDAERMGLATDSVDCVLCRWGYMLMINPGSALAETRRVLRPGGRLALSVFGRPEQNPVLSIVAGLLVREGHMPAPRPDSPGIFALADPSRIRELLARAGFSNPEIEEIPLQFTFDGLSEYWRFLLELAGAVSPVLQEMSQDTQSKFRTKLVDAIEPFRTAAGYSFPAVCLNAATQ